MKVNVPGLVARILSAASAEKMLSQHIARDGQALKVGQSHYPLDKFGKVYLLGVGKAVVPMAKAMEEILADDLSQGLLIVKEGHSEPGLRSQVYQASHPVPSQSNIKASQELWKLAGRAGPEDLVIFLLSGGGSALFEIPEDGLNLKDLQLTTQILLNCGANIYEINSVRKRLSRVKGSKLAQQIAPAQGLGLIVSDVVGNDLSVVGSGPTVEDRSTFADALEVLSKYQLSSQIPKAVLNYLYQGKDLSHSRKKFDNFLIGDNSSALNAAAEFFSEEDSLMRSSAFTGDVCDLAALLIQEFFTAKKDVFIAGGESTVKVKGQGLGGRNQQLALEILNLLSPDFSVHVLCLGTDGSDGPTDAAGASIHSQMNREGLKEALAENNAYPWLEERNALIKTGPTGTNVMDVVVIWREN